MTSTTKNQTLKVTNSFIPKEEPFSKKWFRSYTYIILGTFIMSVGYVFFITPHKITPGGVYGISILLHHLIGTPLGLTALLFNIPITLIGIKILGPRFGIKTVIGFVISENLSRGSTLIHGTGNYTKRETPIIFVVLNRREVEILLGYVKSIDPDAFITVVDANKILGRGFGSLKEYEA